MVLLQCVLVILTSVFEISHISAAECDLEKIYRTPKTMSNINFDHFELLERGGLDVDTTTTPQPPETKSPRKKKDRNVANAQVLVRFGGDDVKGSNNIMKIPPQCRNIGGCPHHPDVYTNPYRQFPGCISHYYHPYPPPVPFVFPNYYFSPHADPLFMPPQIREYFVRHPEFFNSPAAPQVFIQGRPMKRGDVAADAIDRDLPEDLESLRTSRLKRQKSSADVLDVSNADIEKKIAGKPKKTYKKKEQEIVKIKEEEARRNVISEESSEESKIEELEREMELIKSLESEENLTKQSLNENSTDSMDNKNSSDIIIFPDETNSTAAKPDEFKKDLDDLFSVAFTEIISTDDEPIMPKLKNINVDFTGLTTPVKSTFNVDFGDYAPIVEALGAARSMQQAPCSYCGRPTRPLVPQYDVSPMVVVPQPPVSNSYRPTFMDVVYNNPPIYPAEVIVPKKIVHPVWSSPLVNVPKVPSYKMACPNYYFYSQPKNVGLTVPARPNVCRQCGQQHSGGNYCDHCGCANIEPRCWCSGCSQEHQLSEFQ